VLPYSFKGFYYLFIQLDGGNITHYISPIVDI
jgi:hypothetical protein